MRLAINQKRNAAETDNRIFFRRPSGDIYAVLSSVNMARLRNKKELDTFLDKQRESGIILEFSEND